MSWDGWDDEPRTTDLRTYYQYSGACPCDNCNPPSQEEE